MQWIKQLKQFIDENLRTLNPLASPLVLAERGLASHHCVESHKIIQCRILVHKETKQTKNEKWKAKENSNCSVKVYPYWLETAPLYTTVETCSLTAWFKYFLDWGKVFHIISAHKNCNQLLAFDSLKQLSFCPVITTLLLITTNALWPTPKLGKTQTINTTQPFQTPLNWSDHTICLHNHNSNWC